MSTAISMPRVRTGRPKREPTPAPHWKELLRWSWDWPLVEPPATFERVIGRWWVRVA